MNDGLNITQEKERQSFGTSGHEEKNRVSRMVPRIGMTIKEKNNGKGICKKKRKKAARKELISYLEKKNNCQTG